ncbi:YbaB/EbfC family nucleoid-associated protein [Parvibaculum sp.]|uniref:YbaB/EbfC family nucleoid-associated protein n=1 Tax=Parvibaculum sp. TaxID=2024848 RepID=UPI001D6BBD2C|nr:YbaB/EbfC family nucleoid-associated protein [Parvibaculum sp.]MBX3490090.1 YbaB/EbfC family nucleoid-associated protein [Parvibaculum sp.]MCW5725922.1 YbaB/EbfC family nucleoid-associated protein [Parvibaculum sp.]
MKNLADIMKQAQQLQGRMEAMQAELDAAEIEGRAGGGLVAVVMSGKGAVKKVSIDPSLMKEDEREILEDLIVAAAADAKHKAEVLAAEKMKSVAGGLPIPPGFGL